MALDFGLVLPIKVIMIITFGWPMVVLSFIPIGIPDNPIIRVAVNIVLSYMMGGGTT